MTWLIFAIVVLALVFGASLLRKKLSKRSHELKQLCEVGRVVTGTVTSVRKQRRAKSQYNYYMSYSFKPFNAEEFSKEISVSPPEYTRYADGQKIEIVYLPESPEIHAFKPLIDRIRAARR